MHILGTFSNIFQSVVGGKYVSIAARGAAAAAVPGQYNVGEFRANSNNNNNT